MSSYEQEELWRAAQSLHRDGAAQEVLKRMEARCVAEWMLSDPTDGAKRDAAYHMVRAVTAFRQELEALALEPTVSQFNRRLKMASRKE
jgi:hypothetical protein